VVIGIRLEFTFDLLFNSPQKLRQSPTKTSWRREWHLEASFGAPSGSVSRGEGDPMHHSSAERHWSCEWLTEPPNPDRGSLPTQLLLSADTAAYRSRLKGRKLKIHLGMPLMLLSQDLLVEWVSNKALGRNNGTGGSYWRAGVPSIVDPRDTSFDVGLEAIFTD
jgi:hypothetical protein